MRTLLEEALSKDDIEHASELLKERIYSTIVLLALLTTMWQAVDHFKPQGAFISIFGTAITLWLAIAVASRMSYQVVHGKRMDIASLREILAVSRPLLTPALPPLIFIALSWLGIITLSTALIISIVVLLLSFVLYSILAGLRIHTTWYEIIISSVIEVGIGVAAVLLKIAFGH